MRLDVRLVNDGAASSRERAKELIKGGQVEVAGKCITKASYEVNDDEDINVTGEVFDYVGRGALKLIGALTDFEISVKDLVCMDIGASTGGFTEVMVRHGAAKVYAVDVGSGQLAERLKNDTKVVSLENTDIRELPQDAISEGNVDFISVDVSFISLTLILPEVKRFLKENGQAVCLIKPQFEAGRKNIGKHGVVKDKKVHESVVKNITAFAESLSFKVLNVKESPIKGGDGNTEFLMHIRKGCDR